MPSWTQGELAITCKALATVFTAHKSLYSPSEKITCLTEVRDEDANTASKHSHGHLSVRSAGDPVVNTFHSWRDQHSPMMPCHCYARSVEPGKIGEDYHEQVHGEVGRPDDSWCGRYSIRYVKQLRQWLATLENVFLVVGVELQRSPGNVNAREVNANAERVDLPGNAKSHLVREQFEL